MRPGESEVGEKSVAHEVFDDTPELPNELSGRVQKVFEDNMECFGNKIEELVYANEEKGMALGRENKVEFITLPPKELEKVYAVADNTIREQMKELDAKGLPGTAVYEDMRRLIKEYSK